MVKSPILEKQKTDLEKEELGRKILGSCRSELLVNLRYFDLAFGSLPLITGETKPAGTDGAFLYYSPEEIIELYRNGRTLSIRLYLHIILHCLLGHPFDGGGRDGRLWNLACDVAVESLIDGMRLKCVHTGAGAFRKSTYAWLGERLPVLSAQGIYMQLGKERLSGQELLRLENEFRLDDHWFWEYGPDDAISPEHGMNPDRARIKKRWEDVRERMRARQALFGDEASDETGGLIEQLDISGHKRYDYREFLRKFMVLREEIQVDPDSFDYIFYNYGMTLYGNMPIIEPLETAEVKGIEELVIVIDTSMSCSGELVQTFLEETFHILEEEGSFFRRFRVHIIQCDEKVQSDVLIENGEEREEYLSHFTLQGGGGTDFRPAFAYVERQMVQKRYGRLKGLLYFTDGYGIFPVKMPPYETAFIFMQGRYRDVDVPPWAIKLILDETDLREVEAEEGVK